MRSAKIKRAQPSHRALIGMLCACAIGWTTALSGWAQAAPLDSPLSVGVRESAPTESAKDLEIRALRGRIDALEQRLNTLAAAPLAAAPASLAADSGGGGASALEPINPELAGRALERTLVRSGALLLRPGQIELEPTLSYSRAETTSADLFNVSGGAAAIGAQTRVRADRGADLTLRAGLPFDAQAEIGIAGVSAERTVTSSVNGQAQTTRVRETSLGDLRVGLAKSLLRERGALPDVIGRVTWDTNTGSSNGALGAGSGFNEVEAGLVAIKRQDPLVFVGGVQVRRALERDGLRPGNAYSGQANVSLAVSPETSLRMGVRFTRIEQARLNGATLVGTQATPISLSLGAGTVVGKQRFVDVGVEIGLTEDAPQIALGVSMPLRGRLPLR